MPVSPIAMLKMDLASQMPQEATGGVSSGKKGKFDAVMKALEQNEPREIPQRVGEVQTPVHAIVNSISKSEKRLNDLVSLGLSGEKFSTQQLLMMQAGVYRATIAIDVVSKGVEQTTGGLKTLLQSQV